MKKVMIIALLSIFYFSGVLMADKTGVGAERNQDRTGSPVATSSTQQCDKCHSGGNFGAAISLRLKDLNGNVVTEYNGGENYTYEVEVTGTSSRFGFQSVALLSTNTNAGLLAVNSSNAKITTISTRKYAEHKTPSTTGLFVMNWTAPIPGSGTVKFYASGNCVNNNNNDNGDQPVLSTPLIISESAVSGINDETASSSISVYPNPSVDVVNIVVPADKMVNVIMMDATGKFVYQENGMKDRFNIDVSNFENGIYFIYITGDMTATKKFIKK